MSICILVHCAVNLKAMLILGTFIYSEQYVGAVIYKDTEESSL